MNTCDYYFGALDNLGIDVSHSVKVSFYHLLNNQKLFENNNIFNTMKYSIYRYKQKYENRSNGFFRKNKQEKIKKTDLLFQYQYPSINYFGIQKYFATKAKALGYDSSLLAPPKTIITNIPFQGINVSSNKVVLKKELEERIFYEAKILIEYLKTYYFPLLNEELLFDMLYNLAIKIEKLIYEKKSVLERTNPKLVIILNAKGIDESALVCACNTLGIKSFFIPHGFPQKSIAPVESTYIASYGKGHNKYFNSLLNNNKSKIINFGWLEPLVTLPQIFDVNQDKKLSILLLSQLGGYQIHRLPSLYQLIPKVLDSLENIESVQLVMLRLRVYEVNSEEIKSLKLEKYKKIKLVTDEPIDISLSQSNMIISFSSTGLLYGPYLNKKVIEIRDENIDNTWDRILDDKNVFYTDINNFNNEAFEDLVQSSEPINGDEFFYNFKNELNKDTLSEIII